MAEGNEPRIWPGELVTTVTICVLSASGIILNIIPFLPMKHFSSEFYLTANTVREATLVVVGALSVVILGSLEIKRKKLHDQGKVFWPFRCQHCLTLFTKVEKYRKAAASCTSRLCPHEVERSKDTQQIHISPIHKSTLLVTYIFATLILCFLVLKLILSAICIYDVLQNGDDSRYISPAETDGVVKGIVLDTLLLAGVYIVEFYFIHNFFDAYIIPLPIMGWSIGLTAVAFVWIALLGFVEPFKVIATQGTSLQPSNVKLVNGSHNKPAFKVFVEGAAEACEPLLVEFPVMIAWITIQICLRALPRHYFSIMKEIAREDSQLESGPTSVLANGSVRQHRTDSRNQLSGSFSEHSVLLEDDCPSGYGSIHRDQDESLIQDHNSLDQTINIEGPIQDPLDNQVQRPVRSRRFGRWKVELFFAVSIVIGGVYFGMSNFILVGGFHNSSENTERGRFTQWIFKFAFFLPSIVFMLIQMNLTRNKDGSFVARRRNHDIDHVSERYLFLILSTGACMYEVCCFFASLCNLMIMELPEDTIRLNIVSIVSCIFDIFHINLETVFLLNVQNQKLQPGLQTEWTLVCMVYIGVANVAQWLWDSMIHKVTSPLAWPALVTCFGQEVGMIIGLVTAPFDHLFELHAALLALEIFKLVSVQANVRNE